MAGQRFDIPALVKLFLPLDVEALELAYEEAGDVDRTAAALASFSVAAMKVVSGLESPERIEFCRRVAALSDGEVQAWMVEANLRSIEGDDDAVSGADQTALSQIHLYGLRLISTDYLSVSEAEALRGPATERALELRPQIAALTDQ
jgi:hypothetical protein